MPSLITSSESEITKHMHLEVPNSLELRHVALSTFCILLLLLSGSALLNTYYNLT